MKPNKGDYQISNLLLSYAIHGKSQKLPPSISRCGQLILPGLSGGYIYLQCCYEEDLLEDNH
jgi:hypothetical protein